MERVQIDLIVLTSALPEHNDDFKYILTVKDHFSKYVWLRPLRHNWARNEMDPPYPPMANPSNDSVAPLLRSSALTSVLDSVPLLKSGEYN
jgi:hypothetical protein